MPIYTYRCTNCQDLYEPWLDPTSDHKAVLDTGNFVCHRSACSGTYRRVFNANIMPAGDGFGDGHLSSDGVWVSSKRQMDERNKIKSEQATLRTGVEHRFETVDLMDVKPPEVD